MYYTVKVGSYYVKSVEVAFGGFIGEIKLSKEIQGHYTKEGAKRIANMLNGEVVEVVGETTNEEA